MRPRRAFLVGLPLGAFLGIAYAITPITIVPGLVVAAWPVQRTGVPLATAAGLVIGFGAAFFGLIARVTYACAQDPSCVEPNAAPWLAIGAAIVGIGFVLGLVARWQARGR